MEDSKTSLPNLLQTLSDVDSWKVEASYAGFATSCQLWLSSRHQHRRSSKGGSDFLDLVFDPVLQEGFSVWEEQYYCKQQECKIVRDSVGLAQVCEHDRAVKVAWKQ